MDMETAFWMGAVIVDMMSADKGIHYPVTISI